jgi:hypothetical protein
VSLSNARAAVARFEVFIRTSGRPARRPRSREKTQEFALVRISGPEEVTDNETLLALEGLLVWPRA